MAVRQYIGARYVPLYDGTWNETKNYESLTIVEYNNGSYISKKNTPAGTSPLDTEYWANIGVHTQQIETLIQEVADISEDVEDNTIAINNLMETMGQSRTLEYFRNKRVYILGDSISDNTTNPPNWTVHFTNILSLVDATVINLAENGQSFLGLNQKLNSIPTDGDIYIIFLGINDYQFQTGIITDTTTYGPLATCVNSVIARCTNIGADVYYVSPIKTFMNRRTTDKSTLNFYRAFLEYQADFLGARVISGYNAPYLNTFTQPTLMSDKLHPDASYAETLAKYILSGVLSGVSTFSPATNFKIVRQTSDLIVPCSAAFVTTTSSAPSFRNVVDVIINDAVLTQGWNDICALGGTEKGFYNDPCEKCNTLINEVDGNKVLVQITNGTLQFYSDTSTTKSISGKIEFQYNYADNKC